MASGTDPSTGSRLPHGRPVAPTPEPVCFCTLRVRLQLVLLFYRLVLLLFPQVYSVSFQQLHGQHAEHAGMASGTDPRTGFVEPCGFFCSLFICWASIAALVSAGSFGLCVQLLYGFAWLCFA